MFGTIAILIKLYFENHFLINFLVWKNIPKMEISKKFGLLKKNSDISLVSELILTTFWHNFF